MNSSIPPIPEGYTVVTPWIIGRDTAGLMAFLKEAFGAEELARLTGENGRIGHAEMRIGGAVVMMFDAPTAGWPPTPAFIRLYLPDADAAFARAVKSGAVPITEVTHLPFGDRVGRVRDPFGNVWWLQTPVETVTFEEGQRRMSDPKWAEAMAYVEGAKFFD